MQSFQPTLPAFVPANGACITNNSNPAGSSIYLVPLTVPVGAHLISVDVATYDGAGSVSAIALKKTTVSTTGSSETTLASGGGSLSAAFGVRHDVLAPTGQIAAANDSFAVQLGNMANGNSFCGLTVTYDVAG